MQNSSFDRALQLRMRRWASLLVSSTAVAVGMALVTCSEHPSPPPPVASPLAPATPQPAPAAVPASDARIERIRGAFPGVIGPAAIERFESAPGGGIRARSGATRAIAVELPADAAAPVRIADERSGVAVTFALEGAAHAPMAAAHGYALYAAAAPSGGDVLHRPHALGDEDFVYFAQEPERKALRYDVDVSRAAGLRLVSSTLEFLDAKGAPRLRVAPPVVVDAGGRHLQGELSIGGCAVDVSPRAPWGRPVTAPGASSCVVTVSWAHLGAGVRYPALVDPQWMSTSAMKSPRWNHAIAPVPNLANPMGGTYTVLVTGGFTSDTVGAVPTNTAELYEPITQTFAMTDTMGSPRAAHTATPFPQTPTLVLIAGSAGSVVSATPPEGLTGASISTEIYDAVKGKFMPGPPMKAARFFHTATGLGLADGRILLAGGTTSTAGPPLPSADIFTPVATSAVGGTIFGANGPMMYPRFGHAAAVIPTTGKVLLTGGIGGAGGTPALFATETFCTAAFCPFNADTFMLGPPMHVARAFHTATAFDSGVGVDGGEAPNVLIAGGIDGYPDAASTSPAYLSSAEVYVPAPPAFLTISSMTHARAFHTATALLLGFGLPTSDAGTATATAAVLLAGGYDGAADLPLDAGGYGSTGDLALSEAFFPSISPSFVATSSLMYPRRHAAAALVNAGGAVTAGSSVLVTGGVAGSVVTATAELFLKPNGDSCSSTGECASGFCADNVCCDSACITPCFTCSADAKPDGGTSGTCTPSMPGALSVQCVDSIQVNNSCDAGTPFVSQTVDCRPNSCGANNFCSCFCDGSNPCAPNGWCDFSIGPSNACLPAGGSGPGGGTGGGSAGAGGTGGGGTGGGSPGGGMDAGTCKLKGIPNKGAPCKADEECASNSDGTGDGGCYDGYCCNQACTGQCEACNVGGFLGTCTLIGAPTNPVPPQDGGVHPRPACNGVPTSCGGFCNGKPLSCTYPNGGDVLQQPDCSNLDGGTRFVRYPCDGDGGSLQADGTCGGYLCSDGGHACESDCGADTDCAAAYICAFANPTASRGTCQLLTGSLCDGQSTLRVPTDAGRMREPCPNNFACPAGADACAPTCQAVTDCAAHFVCDEPSHTCVSPLTPPPPPSCTACSVAETDAGTGRAASMMALGALATMVLRRRAPARRRSRCKGAAGQKS